MDEADRQRDPSARAQEYLAVAKRAALFQKTVLKSAELERLRCIALRASGARDQAVTSCTQATQRPLHSLQPWSAWLELARTLAETSDDEETQTALLEAYQRMATAPAQLRADTAQSIALQYGRIEAVQEMAEMLVLSVRDGLSLHTVACDPEWQHVYKTKKTQPSIDQVFREYAPKTALLNLQRAIPCD